MSHSWGNNLCHQTHVLLMGLIYTTFHMLWHIKASGVRYVRIAEVNGNYWKCTGVWQMDDSELRLETSG